MPEISVAAGTAHIDVAMLTALRGEGLDEKNARELARLDAFGGSDVLSWIEGLRVVARLLNHRGQVMVHWDTLYAPWNTIGPALEGAGNGQLDEALIQATSHYSLPVQSALITALGTVARAQAIDLMQAHNAPLESKPNIPHARQVESEAQYLRPIDPELVAAVQRTLVTAKAARTTEQRRKIAGELVVDWLVEHGKLLRTPEGRRYYLYRPLHQLYALDTDAWAGFLYRATAVNPASTNYRYLKADCLTAADQGERIDVVRVAHYDTQEQILRISRFDGQVYRLDGVTIEREANGDGPVLFDDNPLWLPYEPDLTAPGDTLDWSFTLPHWEDENEAEIMSLIYRTWWLATFFSELCPTKPILALKGEKGSGKSMALRVLLQLLFGPLVNVCGTPERPDAFTAMTSNAHIVVMDNMDNLSHELRDKLASLSTGKQDKVRELYTTNEERTILYRCWLAVASRTPDTLQRDDVVDRCLILPVARIEARSRTRESVFLEEVHRKRNAWWGELLQALNRIVGRLRSDGLPLHGGLRMEDWSALGSVIALAAGQESQWTEGMKKLSVLQSEFLLEDNVVRSAVMAWARNIPPQFPQLVTTRELYGAAKSALFKNDRPDSTWPQSAKSFGRRLAEIRDELRAELRKENVDMSWRIHRGEQEYIFVRHTP